MNETNATIIGQGVDFLDKILSGIVSKLVVAAIILLIGFIFGKLLGKLVLSFLRSIELDRSIRKATTIKVPLEEIASTTVTYFVYFVTVIMALNQIGVTTDILNIIAAAVMVIIILSVFLGIKDFIPNAMSGISIYRKGFFQEGDTIAMGNIEGKIVHISLIETHVETKNGDLINIPNSNFTKNNVTKKKIRKRSYKKRLSSD